MPPRLPSTVIPRTNLVLRPKLQFKRLYAEDKGSSTFKPVKPGPTPAYDPPIQRRPRQAHWMGRGLIFKDPAMRKSKYVLHKNWANQKKTVENVEEDNSFDINRPLMQQRHERSNYFHLFYKANAMEEDFTLPQLPIVYEVPDFNKMPTTAINKSGDKLRLVLLVEYTSNLSEVIAIDLGCIAVRLKMKNSKRAGLRLEGKEIKRKIDSGVYDPQLCAYMARRLGVNVKQVTVKVDTPVIWAKERMNKLKEGGFLQFCGQPNRALKILMVNGVDENWTPEGVRDRLSEDGGLFIPVDSSGRPMPISKGIDKAELLHGVTRDKTGSITRGYGYPELPSYRSIRGY